MPSAQRVARTIPPLLAAALLLGSCAPAPDPSALPRTSDHVREVPVAAPPGPGQPAAAGSIPKDAVAKNSTIGPDGLPPGSLYRNPTNGRDEIVVEDIQNTAVLIGDSQSEPSRSWTRRALADLGFNVVFCGGSGTGFVAGNGVRGNYIDALENGDWHLPYGAPPLVLIEGGGNDATKGASDFDIEEHAERLIEAVEQRYPAAEVVLVGTLARGAQAGGGRRTQVDSLLGAVAKEYGLSFVSVGDWLTRYGLSQYLADDRHLNAEGHELAGELLSRRLEALGIV